MKNEVFHDGRFLSAACSFPAIPASGDPVLVGQMPGVAQTDERADGLTSVDFGPVVVTLPVTAAAGAIAPGAKLYATSASPVVISNTNTGIPYGFAWGSVGNGLTAAINVKVQPF